MTRGVGYSGTRDPNVAGVSSSGVSGSGVVGVLVSSYTPSTVTWNPSAKGAGITLSGDNLVVNTATNNHGVRANSLNASVDGLKKYYEVLVGAGTVNFSSIGVSTGSHSLISYVGSSAGISSGAWRASSSSTGQIYWNNRAANQGYATGDIVGVLLDFTVSNAGIVSFTKNGVLLAVVADGFNSTTTPFFPAVSIGNTDTTLTGRFDPASWSYTPPAGYDSWQ